MMAAAANAPVEPLRAWRALLDALGEPAWIVEPAHLAVCAVNDEALALLGRDSAQVLGQAADSLIATPEDLAYWDEVRAGQAEPLCSDTSLVDGSGRLLQVTRRIRRLDDLGAGPHYLVALQDRSDVLRQQAERERLVSELQATLESTGDGILVTDLAGRISAFNQRFAQMWGLPAELLTTRNDTAVQDWMRRSVVDPAGYTRRLAAIDQASLTESTERVELLSGQVLERVTHPQCIQGRTIGRVWAFRDRTELVQAGQRIAQLTTTDPLTGLANRRRLAELLGLAIQRSRMPSNRLALLLLDLDRFRQVNEGLGQPTGDRVLRDTAERLKACMRRGDVLARLGADQFALLLAGADRRDAELAARRMLGCRGPALQRRQPALHADRQCRRGAVPG